jgi:hypothetical protein
MGSIVVTEGSPAKTSAPRRNRSSPAQGLTDTEGDAINQGKKPGEFRIPVSSGYTPLGSRRAIHPVVRLLQAGSKSTTTITADEQSAMARDHAA